MKNTNKIFARNLSWAFNKNVPEKFDYHIKKAFTPFEFFLAIK